MYNVTQEVFKTFLENQRFATRDVLPPENIPCIIEFRRGDILKAKVEVKNFKELRRALDGVSVTNPDNKYWIRGNEWEVDQNGQPIQKLSY
jgi:hypothetical protein